MEEQFNSIINGGNPPTEFCIWPMKEDNSSLILLLQLCGTRDCVELYRNSKSVKVNLRDLNQQIEIIESNERLKIGKNQNGNHNK
jgi:hypothetical protein